MTTGVVEMVTIIIPVVLVVPNAVGCTEEVASSTFTTTPIADEVAGLVASHQLMQCSRAVDHEVVVLQ